MVSRQCRFLLFQQVDGLRKRQVGRNSLEAGEDLRRLDEQVLKKQDLSSEIHRHAGNLPAIVLDFLLMNNKVAAPIQVTKNSPSEANWLEERAINARNAKAMRVDQDVSLHPR